MHLRYDTPPTHKKSTSIAVMGGRHRKPRSIDISYFFSSSLLVISLYILLFALHVVLVM